ncbi:MAG TPA: thioredoxin [Opitutaceae bacterium]|nr:thioredoxin [Opitutaceae bacterium]
MSTTTEHTFVSATAQSFAQDVIEASRSRLVLVDFWAAWCGPCKALARVLDQVAEESGEEVAIVKVDVDAEDALAAAFNIRSLPTLVLFSDGKEIDRIVGLVGPQYITSHLDKALPPAAA